MSACAATTTRSSAWTRRSRSAASCRRCRASGSRRPTVRRRSRPRGRGRRRDRARDRGRAAPARRRSVARRCRRSGGDCHGCDATARAAGRFAMRPPILLIHGAFTRGRALAAVGRAISARPAINASAPSLPGHGPPDPRALAAADLRRLRRGASPRSVPTFDRPPVVIGHSMGGLIAQHLAAPAECAGAGARRRRRRRGGPAHAARGALCSAATSLPVLTRPADPRRRERRRCDLVLHDLSLAEQRGAPRRSSRTSRARPTARWCLAGRRCRGRGALSGALSSAAAPTACWPGRSAASSRGSTRPTHRLPGRGHWLVAGSLVRRSRPPSRLDRRRAWSAQPRCLPFGRPRTYKARSFARRRHAAARAARGRAVNAELTMAGHSQFKNIMHKKGAADARRSKLFSKLAREITVAAKIGMPDPDMNPRLRLAIQNARAENMPKDNIERAIKKAIGGDAENYEEIRYEGYGPGGVAMIVEALTDNRNRTAGAVRSYFTKIRRRARRDRLGRVHVRSRRRDRLPAARPATPTRCSRRRSMPAPTTSQSDDDGHVITCVLRRSRRGREGARSARSARRRPSRRSGSRRPRPASTRRRRRRMMKLIAALEDDDDVQARLLELRGVRRRDGEADARPEESPAARRQSDLASTVAFARAGRYRIGSR